MKTINRILVCVIALAVLFGASSYTYAFIGPSQNPPGDNGLLVASSTRALGIATTTIYSTESQMLFKTLGGSNQHIILSPNGYVGIATTTPSEMLYVFGNIGVSGNVEISGSFVGALSGSLSAANISSEVFGRLQGEGNFAFPASLGVATSTEDGLPQSLSVYGGGYFSGDVGIGTAGPGAKLDVAGDIRGGGGFYPNYASDTGSHIGVSSVDKLDLYADSYIVFRVNGGVERAAVSSSKLYTASGIDLQSYGELFVEGTGNSYILGNVGIGTAGPDTQLHIHEPSVSGSKLTFTNTDTGEAVTDGFLVGIGDSEQGLIWMRENKAIYFSTNDTERITILAGGDVGIGDTTPSYKLEVAGTFLASGNWSLGGGALTNLNMDSKNITAVNKLSVTTIDPLYNIGGIKYATYVPSIVGGVKEEYIGRSELAAIPNDEFLISNYEYVIDFNEVEQGSDLWVWYKAVDFSRESVNVFVTPYGQSANIYYVIEGNKLIFRGDKPAEFSYRLISKRFDWREWPTLVPDQNEEANLIIK